MVRLIKQAYSRRWLTLPRAANGTPHRRNEARRRASMNMASHLMFAAGRDLRDSEWARAFADMVTAIRLYPVGIARKLSHPSTFQYLKRSLRMFLSETCHSASDASKKNEMDLVAVTNRPRQEIEQ
jgi:hypothetical protein